MQLVALTKRSCAESDRHRPVASTRLRPVVLAVAAVFAGPAAAQVPPIYIAQKINTPPDSIVGPSGGSVLNSFGVNDSSVIGAMQYFGGPIVTWQNRVVHSLPSATGRALNNAQDIVGSARVDTVNGVVSVAMKWTPGHSGVTVRFEQRGLLHARSLVRKHRTDAFRSGLVLDRRNRQRHQRRRLGCRDRVQSSDWLRTDLHESF